MKDKRQHVRHPYKNKVCLFNDKAHLLYGTSCNISEAGLCVEVENILDIDINNLIKVGSQGHFAIENTVEDSKVVIKGNYTVKWIQDFEYQRSSHIGLEYSNLISDSKDELLKLLKSFEVV